MLLDAACCDTSDIGEYNVTIATLELHPLPLVSWRTSQMITYYIIYISVVIGTTGCYLGYPNSSNFRIWVPQLQAQEFKEMEEESNRTKALYNNHNNLKLPFSDSVLVVNCFLSFVDHINYCFFIQLKMCQGAEEK